MTTTANHYTLRVGARAELCATIKRDHLAEAVSIGLTAEDLTEITAQGETAREADRRQQTQLAGLEATRTGRKLTAAEIFEREEGLRNRLPAVVSSLEATLVEQARWLSALSFARYRIRELPVPEAALAADPEIKRVERVEREDIPARLEALARFCTSMLEAGREPIVEALAARMLSRTELETLAADADALARQGRNLPAAAEATAREAAAVAAQRKRWGLVRKMIRSLCAGVPALTTKLGEC